MKTLFYNGHLYSEDGSLRGKTAVLVSEGRILRAGTDAELLSAAEADTERIDWRGAYVYPGFCDSHLHILSTALGLHRLVLNGIPDRGSLLRAIKEKAKTTPPGEWIEGRGFNEDLWPDPRLPLRSELDEAAPEHPVRITRVCGHLAIGNTAALKRTGIARDTAVPGGTVDPLSGIVTENAVSLLFPKEADPGAEHCARMLEEGLNLAADAGLTCVYSDDLTAGNYGADTVLEAYRLLREAGRMPVRVVEQCDLDSEEKLDRFVQKGHRCGEGDGFFRIGPRKLYADGSLGAATAWLTVPYADREKTFGVPVHAPEEMNALVAQAHRYGFPCVVHAIGDAAAECVLDAVEYARRAVPGTEDLPDGLVHCQITSERTLKRIRDLKVCVYAQPVFLEYDLHICEKRVGPALARTSYAWKTLLDSGVTVSSGSDSPVETPDAAANIYCAVARRDLSGFPEGGWMPEQKLTVREAIRCHTRLAARAVGLEEEAGRIAPGFRADFTVYPEALEAVPEERLKELIPVMTVVDGRPRTNRRHG